MMPPFHIHDGDNLIGGFLVPTPVADCHHVILNDGQIESNESLFLLGHTVAFTTCHNRAGQPNGYGLCRGVAGVTSQPTFRILPATVKNTSF
jgi:hypothetical protein